MVFKNPYGQWESNHYLKLELANGENVDVEVEEFKAAAEEEFKNDFSQNASACLIADKAEIPNKMEYLGKIR